MNNITLIGRLTRDPEIKTIPSGKVVANFTLAVDRRFKSPGQQEVDFINCQAWGKTGEIIEQYVSKGRQLGVAGRLQIRKYQDKDGNNRYATEVVVDQFTFVGNKNDDHPQGVPNDDSLNDVDFHLMAADDSVPF